MKCKTVLNSAVSSNKHQLTPVVNTKRIIQAKEVFMKPGCAHPGDKCDKTATFRSMSSSSCFVPGSVSDFFLQECIKGVGFVYNRTNSEKKSHSTRNVC